MTTRTQLKNDHEHQFSQENLSAYLDQQLTAAYRARVARHLEVCESCRRDLAALQRTIALISQAPRMHAPRSFALPQSMQSAQARQRRWERVFAFARTAAVIASALMIVFLAGDVALTFRRASFDARPSAQPETFVAATAVVELGADEEPMMALKSAPLPTEVATEQWAEPEQAVAAAPQVIEGAVEETTVAEVEAEMVAMRALPTLEGAAPTPLEGRGSGEVTSLALPSEAPAVAKAGAEISPTTPSAADTPQATVTEEPVVATATPTQAPPTEVPTPPPPTEQPTPLPPTPEPTPRPTEAPDERLAAAAHPSPTEVVYDVRPASERPPYWQVQGWLRTLWMLTAGLLLILLGTLVWAAYRKHL